jgi:hypothetical protein
MLKKRIHNHYFYQTNPKPQPKPETNLKTQPTSKLVHRNHLQQQPKKSQMAECLEMPICVVADGSTG